MFHLFTRRRCPPYIFQQNWVRKLAHRKILVQFFFFFQYFSDYWHILMTHPRPAPLIGRRSLWRKKLNDPADMTSCAIFMWATSALSPAWGSCHHLLTSPRGVQLGLMSCPHHPTHTHKHTPLISPWAAPRRRQLLPLLCPLCQTRSQNIYKHMKIQTFSRTPEHCRITRDPLAVHAHVRTCFPSVSPGAPSEVYDPCCRHRVTEWHSWTVMSPATSRPVGLNYTCRVSPVLRAGPFGSADGERVSQRDICYQQIPEVVLCKASANWTALVIQ